MGDRKKKKPIARALHEFLGQSEYELTFSTGEAILLLRRIDENWLEGELDGKVGIFPSNRVRVEVGSPSLSQDSAIARSGKPCAVVLHDFEGGESGDLPLEEGQIVELLGRIAAGWMRGRLNGKVGIFPASFVEVVQPLRTVCKPVPHPQPQAATSPPLSPANPKPRPRPMPRQRLKKFDNSTIAKTKSSAPIVNASRKEPIDNGREENGMDKPLVFGDECSNSSPKSRLSLYKDIPSLEQDISSFEASLQAEVKMLESSKELLKVCQDEDKQTELSRAVENHQKNVNDYQEKLEQVEAARDAILNQEVDSPPSTPPSPMVAKVKENQKTIQRQRAIQELYETERDYHKELSALCSKILPSFKKWKDVKYESIFCNIEEVTVLAGDLSLALEVTLVDDAKVANSEGGASKKGVGDVFKLFADRIRDVYGVYCREHDSASQLLEKLMEDQSKAEIIRKYFNLGRPEVISWDLHTLLIKPVQRIVKYPLLLKTVMEGTPPGTGDYKALYSALSTSSQVAQDINEIRRRKDILDRYTGTGRDERRVNFGTLRKKVRRLNQSITQRTGLRTPTVDAKYDREESKVQALESSVKCLQQNVLSWLQEGERLFDTRESMMEAVTQYMTKNNPVSKDAVKVMSEVHEEWKRRCCDLQRCVISPLSVLLELFHDPVLLMSKRRSKLLDYDSLQHDLEKTTEPDKLEPLREQVTLAKRTYEALNAQLLEDLPVFAEKVIVAMNQLLKVFLRHQLDLHRTLSALLSQATSSVGDYTNDMTSRLILAANFRRLQEVSSELGKLSVVPRTLDVSFGLRQQSVDPTYKPSLKKASSMSPATTVRTPASSSPSSKKGSPAIKRNRRQSEPVKKQTREPLYEEINQKMPQAGEYDQVPNALSNVDSNSNSEKPNIKKETNSKSETTYDSVPFEPPGIAESLDKLLLTPTNSETQLEEEEEECADNDITNIPPKGTMLVALYDFEPEYDTELAITEGERVSLVCGVDDGGNSEWWLVQRLGGDRRKGYVPHNYLSVLT